MESDPGQTRNLCEEQPEIAARHDHLLAEWLQEQAMKPYATPDPFSLVLQERAGQRKK
jgi:hypothetical protein